MNQPNNPPPPPAQRLEIAFVEHAGAEQKLKPGGKDPSERWVHAGEGLQTTAKWIITALAGVGAIMFAKGFVTTPKLDWVDDRDQLLIAWGLGVVGVIGIAWLIWATSNVLSPSVLTLGTLPKDFVALVEANPNDYLPTGATTVAQFNRRLLEYRRASAEVTDLVRKEQRKLEQAKAATAEVSSE